jgi:hypothetical protein
MKEGARPLAPLIRGFFSVDSAASALGLGWLTASLALSGSPIAATSLSLLDANILSPIETFAMISGSRLGASFVVLLIGFVYMIRGRQREISLSVGLTSLLVTQTLYPMVLLAGYFLLTHPWMQTIQVIAAQELSSPFETLMEPYIAWLLTFLPDWALFPAGFLFVLAGLALFDRSIPELNLQNSEVRMVPQLVYRPIVVFLLGAAITVLTMSVSVSLSLLVPLSVRGFIRLENAVPYILGANITTFIDTLIAAALLANPAAVTIVLVLMVSVTLISGMILFTNFKAYERVIRRLVVFIGQRKTHLVIYVILILGMPFLLLWLG